MILELPFEIHSFPMIGTSDCLNFFVGCFLPDILVYIKIINDNSYIQIISEFTKGLTAFHIVHYMFFGGDYVLLKSIITNSFIISTILTLAISSKENPFKVYALYMPFFIYYSFGPTKEIFVTMGMILLLCYDFDKNKFKKYLISLVMIIIGRPQFTPLILFNSLLKEKLCPVLNFVLVSYHV